MAKDRPDWLEATIFNRLIPGLVTSGKESDLDDFTKWMMSFNVSPSEATWNSLIDAAVETGGAAKGETVARQALERGADIGLWGWNSLMKVRVMAQRPSVH